MKYIVIITQTSGRYINTEPGDQKEERTHVCGRIEAINLTHAKALCNILKNTTASELSSYVQRNYEVHVQFQSRRRGSILLSLDDVKRMLNDIEIEGSDLLDDMTRHLAAE